MAQINPVRFRYLHSATMRPATRTSELDAATPWAELAGCIGSLTGEDSDARGPLGASWNYVMELEMSDGSTRHVSAFPAQPAERGPQPVDSGGPASALHLGPGGAGATPDLTPSREGAPASFVRATMQRISADLLTMEATRPTPDDGPVSETDEDFRKRLRAYETLAFVRANLLERLITGKVTLIELRDAGYLP